MGRVLDLVLPVGSPLMSTVVVDYQHSEDDLYCNRASTVVIISRAGR